jgi:hypothetical protein
MFTKRKARLHELLVLVLPYIKPTWAKKALGEFDSILDFVEIL